MVCGGIKCVSRADRFHILVVLGFIQFTAFFALLCSSFVDTALYNHSRLLPSLTRPHRLPYMHYIPLTTTANLMYTPVVHIPTDIFSQDIIGLHAQLISFTDVFYGNYSQSAGSRLTASRTRCLTSRRGITSGTAIKLHGLGKTDTIEAAGDVDPPNTPTMGIASFANIPVGDGGSRGSNI